MDNSKNSNEYKFYAIPSPQPVVLTLEHQNLPGMKELETQNYLKFKENMKRIEEEKKKYEESCHRLIKKQS